MELDGVTGQVILDLDDIPTPVRTGYTFEGWAYDAAGTEPVGEDDIIEADDILYAVWEAE